MHRLPAAISKLLPLTAILLAVVGCGHKIGDSCTVSSDCAQDGTRVCDTFSPGGSCTIAGCDFGTCPEEAVCVRFFPALDNARACAAQEPKCDPDEICTIDKKCAPRSIELRFCMLSCSSESDCRSGYECRDADLMRRHGGEPVPNPAAATSELPNTPFCASRRPCANQSECDVDEICDINTRICLPK